MTAIAYSVRRSDRAHRARVTVSGAGEVEVVLPRSMAEHRAEHVLSELAPWIRRRLGELERARQTQTRPPGTVPYLGRHLELVPQPGRRRVRQDGGRLLVPEPTDRAALERWYRRAAAVELAPRVARAAGLLGAQPGPVSVRNQRTRWGSCSSSGALSFNWRLLLAPEPVLDAVVWHEVCHLVVADHSPRFHALVERHCPDHRTQTRWLRRYGSTLRL